MIFSFERLYIYQRSVDFLERMDKVLTNFFPGGGGDLVHEIRNACLAIPTWIANGNGRRDKEDRKDCYRRSRSAAFSCVPCIEILARRGAFPQPVSEAIRDELFCIAKMISALIHSQDRQQASGDLGAAGGPGNGTGAPAEEAPEAGGPP